MRGERRSSRGPWSVRRPDTGVFVNEPVPVPERHDPAVLRMSNHWWEDHGHWMQPRLEAPPSESFHRQFWATFEDDRAGMLTRELLNVDHLMWGSDYPHTEGGCFPSRGSRSARTSTGSPRRRPSRWWAATRPPSTTSRPDGRDPRESDGWRDRRRPERITPSTSKRVVSARGDR